MEGGWPGGPEGRGSLPSPSGADRSCTEESVLPVNSALWHAEMDRRRRLHENAHRVGVGVAAPETFPVDIRRPLPSGEDQPLPRAGADLYYNRRASRGGAFA